MPGYGTSDEIAEMSERIKALEEEKRQLMLEEKKRVERDFCVMPREYAEGMAPHEYVDSQPTFRFALCRGLGDEFLPTRSDPEATGWDVRSAIDLILDPGGYFKIPLGFRAFPPSGWWFQLHPRSSSFAKRSMHTLIGVIDETFPLEVLLCGQYSPGPPNVGPLEIAVGDRIGQIIPIRRQEMVVEKVTPEEFDDLCSRRDARRKGGIGSTG